MPAPSGSAISHSIVIDADPSTVFDVLSDPTQHALFDGSDSVRGQVSGPPRLYLGARFAMRMHWMAPYVIRNTVVEYDEDRRIAWRHFARHIWRYELTPLDDASQPRTQVTETFEWRGSPIGFAYPRVGVVGRNDEAIRATLQRLKVLVEGRAVTAR
jgi:uncharacterized protein YndB with AHSA1/START domain